MKAEKTTVDIQDRRKAQDALTIKRQTTRRFSPPCDTRPINGIRRYAKCMHFLQHLLTTFSQHGGGGQAKDRAEEANVVTYPE